MKKSIFATMLAAFLLVGLVTLGAPVVRAEEAAEGHTHCACGGVYAGHSCTDVTFEPISEALTAAGLTTETADFGKLAAGNYYLDADLTVTGGTAITGKLTICLNGKTVTTNVASNTKVYRPFLVDGGTLTLTDCAYNAETGVWAGTVKGGKGGTGRVVMTAAKSTVNIYGGSYTGGINTKATNGGLLYIVGGSVWADRTTVNMYGGRIHSGEAYIGGNIRLGTGADRVQFNMYGGMIDNGKAHPNSAENNGWGGNMFIDSNCTLNLYEGRIVNGVSAYNANPAADRGCGGNIAVKGNLNVFGGEIAGGAANCNPIARDSDEDGKVDTYVTAAGVDTSTMGCGGNIWGAWSTTNISISGGVIHSGTANGLYGGNIMLKAWGASLNITGGNIWGGVANADENIGGTAQLLKGADVKGGSIAIVQGVFNMTGGSIGTDAKGNAAGGYGFPKDLSRYGNLYIGPNTNTTKSVISGGIIANGTAGYGGNMGGTDYTITGEAQILNGSAVRVGGNLYILEGENVTVSGGTISGGKVTGNNNAYVGGNIYGINTTLYIANATIENGSAKRGGNIYGDNITLTVTDSTISGGKAALNGGNLWLRTGTVTFTGATVSGGTSATDGGNLYAQENPTITATNSRFLGGDTYSAWNNFERGFGGAICIGSGNVTLTDCTVEGGAARYGGALCVKSGTVTVENSTLTGGSGTVGRVIYVHGGTLTLNDCDVTNTMNDGTAIWNSGVLKLAGTVRIGVSEGHSGKGCLDLLVDARLASDKAAVYIDAAELTAQDAVYNCRRYEVDDVDDDLGLLVKNVTEANAGFFAPNNNTLYYYEASGGDLYIRLWNVAVMTLEAEPQFVGGFASLTDACADTEKGMFRFRLNADLDGQIISRDILLDLNGLHMTNTTVNEGVEINLVDTENVTYDAADCGSLSGTVNGTIKPFSTYGGENYIAVADENGVYTSHCYSVAITHVSLDASYDALGYKATLNGDEVVISHVTGFGFSLWVDGGQVKTYSKTGTQTLTLRLKNIMAANGGEMKINANAFVTFDVSDEKITSGNHATTMQETILAVNALEDLTNAQKAAVYGLYEKYSTVMDSWLGETNNIKTWAPAAEEA